ncbi:hypothetical protein PUN28_017333 [Cardiocondyla obscurior]|uniref:Uncharacterized protein n=1 Tax=Cardiocondyla obscurior TaxID=286306 RepID=A0AAW2EQM7_9HYME
MKCTRCSMRSVSYVAEISMSVNVLIIALALYGVVSLRNRGGNGARGLNAAQKRGQSDISRLNSVTSFFPLPNRSLNGQIDWLLAKALDSHRKIR